MPEPPTETIKTAKTVVRESDRSVWIYTGFIATALATGSVGLSLLATMAALGVRFPLQQRLLASHRLC